MTVSARPVVELLGRPGCHLCDDARIELLALQDELRFELIETDIELNDDLLRTYLERIPVVLAGGAHVSDFFVDARALRAALKGPSDGPTSTHG